MKEITISIPQGMYFIIVEDKVVIKSIESVYPEKIEEIIKQRDKLNAQIEAYDDGFKYVVVVSSYGSRHKVYTTNFFKAKEEANEYYDDNGNANIYTNNPNAIASLSSGHVYFLEDLNQLSYSHPKEAKLIE